MSFRPVDQKAALLSFRAKVRSTVVEKSFVLYGSLDFGSGEPALEMTVYDVISTARPEGRRAWRNLLISRLLEMTRFMFTMFFMFSVFFNVLLCFYVLVFYYVLIYYKYKRL